MNLLENIRGVTFDAFGTLLAVNPSVGHLYAEVLAEHGGHATPEEVEARFRQAFAEVTNASEGRILDRAAWTAIVQKTFAGLHPEESLPVLFRALWDTFGQARCFSVLPGVIEVLEALKAHGLPLAVISNNDARQYAVFDQIGLRKYFDHLLLSAEVGVAKPDPGIFRQAERLLGFGPEHLLHIGDSPSEDIAGAQAAGWRCLQVGEREPAPGVPHVKDMTELAACLAS